MHKIGNYEANDNHLALLENPKKKDSLPNAIFQTTPASENIVPCDLGHARKKSAKKEEMGPDRDSTVRLLETTFIANRDGCQLTPGASCRIGNCADPETSTFPKQESYH